MLTEHQKLHLNAILKDVNESRQKTTEEKSVLSLSKRIKIQSFNSYLDEVEKQVNKILNSGNFPNLQKDAHIHDYLEKDNIKSVWQIQQ